MLSHAFAAHVVAAAVAAGAGAHPTPPRAPVITVTATDYHLDIPSTLTAGLTTFRLANHGREPHQLYLVRLESGKTAADLTAALKAASQGGAMPSWATDVGGPNGVDPGATSLATTLQLRPGHYAALCIIPGPDNVPHAMKGMITDVTVNPDGDGAHASFGPRPDDTIELVDYAYRPARPLTAGTHRVLVKNAGQQSHELELARLLPGKTPADLAAWAEHMAGPPPAHFLGGVSPIAPGQENEMMLALSPGHYVMLCFLPDAKDGKPHLAHGMVQEFVVK